MHSVWHECQLILARARWSRELAACKDCVFALFTKSCSSPTQIPLQPDSAATSKLILMSDLHSQTLAPTPSLVVRSIDRRHVCWHGAMMWWMVLASSWNKVLSYLWASLFLHAQQCWNVPVTSQANPELDCWTVGFTKACWRRTTCGRVPLWSQVLEPPKGAAAWPVLSSQVEQRLHFYFVYQNPVYPHPSTTASR